MKCIYCNTEHPDDQIANPHYCIARLMEQVEKLTSNHEQDMIVEQAISQCLREDFNTARKQIANHEQEMNDPCKMSEILLPMGFVVVLRDQWYEMNEQIAALTAEIKKLRTMSTVEMMCENYNVKCHVEEWEKRCLKAEADLSEIKRLDAEVERLGSIAITVVG